MAWVYLIIASAFEVIWALGLKASDGFSKPLPGVITLIGMILSVVFLTLAVKQLPIGTAYAVWTGIGAGLTAIGGMIYFGESKDAWRMLFILLILAGVIGLRMTQAGNGH